MLHALQQGVETFRLLLSSVFQFFAFSPIYADGSHTERVVRLLIILLNLQ